MVHRWCLRFSLKRSLRHAVVPFLFIYLICLFGIHMASHSIGTRSNGTANNHGYPQTENNSVATDRSMTNLERNSKPLPHDLMALEPFNYLPNYKNPCFHKEDGNIACLPYYYLAGVPKAGTTDLSYRIGRHPEVSSNVPKEPHWMTRTRFSYNKALGRFPGIEDYLEIFSLATSDIVQHVPPNSSYHPMIVGDCSASTLWDHSNWRYLIKNEKATVSPHTNADFVHHLNPKAKIIVILRNPVERLYSGYLYFKTFNKTSEHFHNVVQEAISYYQKCFKKFSERRCMLQPPPKAVVRIYIGLYYYYIADYLRVFPRDQLLVLKMEDYSENMSQNLERVFSFLEIAPLDKEKMANIVGKTGVLNSRKSHHRTQGDMLPETRKLLNEFYKPRNKKLERLLGIKFWE